MQQLMEYGGQMKEFAKLMRGETDFYGHFQPLYIDTIVLGQLALSHLDGMSSYMGICILHICQLFQKYLYVLHGLQSGYMRNLGSPNRQSQSLR